MAFRHGKNAVIWIDNSGGTLTDISMYTDQVGMPRSIETGETTNFASPGDAKTYVVGLSDSTLSMSGKFDGVVSAIDAIIAGILGQDASVSFEYGPGGNATGQAKYTGESYCTSYEATSPVADVVTWSAEFQITGVVTRIQYP